MMIESMSTTPIQPIPSSQPQPQPASAKVETQNVETSSANTSAPSAFVSPVYTEKSEASSDNSFDQKSVPVLNAEKPKDILPNLNEATSAKEDNEPDQRLIKVIENANKKLRGINTECQFAIHAKTKQIMVKIMNTETKEVIRELPPEKSLDMIAKMWEMAGLFVDKKM